MKREIVKDDLRSADTEAHLGDASRLGHRTRKLVWAVIACLGVSLHAHAQTTPGSTDEVSSPVMIEAGEDWVPYDYALEIEPGSAFDFSAMNDAPAGQYGRLLATPAGTVRFADQPDEDVRFWGVNLVFEANFPDRGHADKLAAQLARSGYNLVRLHHFDRYLQKTGEKSYEFDPERLERMDYLLAALKKAGIYVTLDLFTIASFQEDEIPDLGRDFSSEFKYLLPVSENAFAAFQKISASLLLHRNPYTGMTWAEDPALIGISVINEDAFTPKVLNTPELARLYDAAFEEWLTETGLENHNAMQEEENFNRFLRSLKKRTNERLFAHIRFLGYEGLLNEENFLCRQAQTFSREQYDYVDVHGYWDHPTFLGQPWKLPYAFSQENPIAKWAAIPRRLMSSRILGKPFAVSEFSYVYPNVFRSAGPILMTAYASLQDWDMICRFQYCENQISMNSPTVPGIFTVTADPIGLYGDRMAAVIFRRKDVSPATQAVCFLVDGEQPFTKEKITSIPFPDGFSKLGLITRIGSSALPADSSALQERLEANGVSVVVTHSDTVDKNKEAITSVPVVPTSPKLIDQLFEQGLITSAYGPPSNGHVVSETGQIDLMPETGAIKVVSARSECFALPAGESLAGRSVSVVNGDIFTSVYVAAIDDEPLSTSRRLLVLHLTNSYLSGTTFGDPEYRELKHFGALPHLVQAGATRIALQVDHGNEDWKIWALDAKGQRLWEVPQLEGNANELTFDARTVSDRGVCFAYEVVLATDSAN